MNTNNTTTTNANHKPGTKVVSKIDGEPGTVVGICTYCRNGFQAWSYLVDTASGREIWHRGDLFLPAQEQA